MCPCCARAAAPARQPRPAAPINGDGRRTGPGHHSAHRIARTTGVPPSTPPAVGKGRGGQQAAPGGRATLARRKPADQLTRLNSLAEKSVIVMTQGRHTPSTRLLLGGPASGAGRALPAVGGEVGKGASGR